jgi:hypothetical protein
MENMGLRWAGVRGNALLFESRPVLASRCPATDLLVAAETRIAEPLPSCSRTNLPAFRQHVTLIIIKMSKHSPGGDN